VSAVSQLTYPEAVVVGAFQGLAELFPVSSLGHSVLLPALVGGQWGRDLKVSTPESPYLAFIVGLHVATAAALLAFYWHDWLQIIRGFGTSIARRRVTEPYERLAWLIVLATIPVGAVGERLSRRAAPIAIGAAGDLRLAGLSYRRGSLIGIAQVLALLPGISRSGVTMVAELTQGLSHQDAARFSFSIRFLTRYFRSGTLRPFAWYCIVAGAVSLLWLVLR
jgi:undecaprenyl-diphosphatase